MDLVLDGDVQGGAGLVGDHQVPLGHDGHGDADTLLHAAGELDGVVGEDPLWVGDEHVPDGVQHHLLLLGFALALALGGVLHHLHHLLADGEHRVQGGGGLLVDHGDLLAAHLAQVPVGHFQHVLTLVEDLPLGDDVLPLRHDAQDGLHRGGFAAAGLPNDAHFFPLVHGEVYAVQHFGVALVDFEPELQIFDLQDHIFADITHTCCPPWRAYRRCRLP